MSKSNQMYMSITEEDMKGDFPLLMDLAHSIGIGIEPEVEPTITITLTGSSAIAIQDMLDERYAKMYIANKMSLPVGDITVEYDGFIE